MPAGYEDQMPTGGADAGGGQLPGMENYSPEELRTAMAQIMAKNAPQGQGQPSPEDLWQLQAQQQGLKQPQVPGWPTMTPGLQAPMPAPMGGNLNFPTAPAGPGAPNPGIAQALPPPFGGKGVPQMQPPTGQFALPVSPGR